MGNMLTHSPLLAFEGLYGGYHQPERFYPEAPSIVEEAGWIAGEGPSGGLVAPTIAPLYIMETHDPPT